MPRTVLIAVLIAALAFVTINDAQTHRRNRSNNEAATECAVRTTIEWPSYSSIANNWSTNAWSAARCLTRTLHRQMRRESTAGRSPAAK